MLPLDGACVFCHAPISGDEDTTELLDYLVERIEEMLEHRIVTGYYPRLALAPGQRFASKGGYVVRFAEPSGSKVVAVSEWMTP